jgi:O-antigen ligase
MLTMQETSITPLRVGGICLDRPQKWERILWAGVVPFLILLNIALNPFPHITSIREISFYSAAALLAFYFFRYQDWSVFDNPLTLPVAVFSVWAFISLFWTLDFSASLHVLYAHLLKYIAMFLLIKVFLNSWARLHLLFWIIIISVMISGFHDMYFFYVVGKNPLLSRMLITNHQLPVGPMGFMAVFAVLLAVHLLQTSEKLWERVGLVVCLAGLLLIFFVTQMRSLLVVLPFVVGALFWDNKKVLIVLMVLLCLFSFVFFTKLRPANIVGHYTDRLTINYMSLLIIKARPVTGIGFGLNTTENHDLINHEKLRAKVPPKIRSDAEYTSPHNMWLELAIQLGIVGLLLFIALFTVAVKVCLTAVRQTRDRELRLTGQLCLSFILLFSFYGLFNVVFMHFLELLLCLSFAMIVSLRDTGNRKA